jgi:hypothetical protein
MSDLHDGGQWRAWRNCHDIAAGQANASALQPGHRAQPSPAARLPGRACDCWDPRHRLGSFFFDVHRAQ